MDIILSKYVNQKTELSKLKQEVAALRVENEWYKNENSRITSEPYYIKTMKFRTKVKETLFYKIYSKLRWGKIEETLINQEDSRLDSINEIDDFSDLLGLDEYRFLRYKRERNYAYKINLKQIDLPYTKGLVSVILPVYNGEDYVALSIDSVLNQTYRNFELIIVNDGSTDLTFNILEEYAEKDPRIKVICQENRKLPKTLSRGFRAAQGEFFTWTSADNIMQPEFLEKFVEEMNRYENTAMLFGNLKLIDENGSPKKDFDWYRLDEKHMDYVILPNNMLELNTIANNYIGAAFMYRAIVANVIEDYSAYKFGIEDYDYWMKVNELFTLRHVSFKEPEYVYRLHSKSLTSKDKELKITENRYKQMLLDDFRRDYFLKKQAWIVECDDKDNECYKQLVKKIIKNGDILITKEKAEQQLENIYERYIYVSFSDVNKKVTCTKNMYKILVSKNAFEVIEPHDWDVFICTTEVSSKDFIGEYKGWFGLKNGEDIFAFIDSKAKNTFLYKLEGASTEDLVYDKTFTIIISSSGEEYKLLRCMKTFENRNDMEIIVIGTNNKLQRISNGKFIKISSVDEKSVTMKNIAVTVAKGKYLIFLNDDCCITEKYLDNISEIFAKNKKVTTIFGNVETILSNRYQKFSKLLGAYEIKEDDLFIYDTVEMPSPYSFVVRNDSLKMAGGFYHLDENTQGLSQMEHLALAARLHKVGCYSYLSSDSTVFRYVEEITDSLLMDYWKDYLYSRYNMELNNLLPMIPWKEILTTEMESLMNNNMIKNINSKFFDIVRRDYLERMKGELNRNLFSQLG